MTKQITISEKCYAELMRLRKANQNDHNGKTFSFSSAILSWQSEIRLLKDEQLKLREEKLELEKTVHEGIKMIEKERNPKRFYQRVKAVFFP